MPADDDLLEEVSGLRKDLEKQHAETEAREKAARQDRINIAVALGIASVFFTLSSRSSSQSVIDLHPIACLWQGGGFECILYIHALLAIAYIPAKIAVINFDPLVESDYLTYLNDQVLPRVYVYNFLGSAASGAGVLFGLNLQSLSKSLFEAVFSIVIPFPEIVISLFLTAAPQSVNQAATTVAQTLLNVSPLTFIVLEIVLAIAPAEYYSRGYQNTMKKVRVSVSDTAMKIGSSQAGATPELTVENPFNNPLDTDELTIYLHPPDEIKAWIPAAVEITDNEYHLGERLMPDDRVQLEIRTQLKPFREPPSDPIVVEIDYEPGSTIREEIPAPRD